MDTINYVDLAGLRVFKGLIENEITKGDEKSIKSVLFNSATRVLNFYKKDMPTENDIPDLSITLPKDQDISNLIEKISGGVKDNVVIIGEGGIIVDSGVAITDVATKTEIEAVNTKVGDISQLNTTAKTDLVKAINEVRIAISAGGESGALSIDTETTTDGMLKSYTIKQGGTTVGTIDIPKDLVVTAGSVVTDPEGEDPGTYIKLVIANQEDPLLINVGKLVDIYKAKSAATQIQLVIDSATREISATIVSGSVGTTELADDAITTVKIADANVTLTKLAVDVMNAFDTAGSATAAETNAKKYADNLDTAMDIRVKSIEGKIGDGFEVITVEEINSLFTE